MSNSVSRRSANVPIFQGEDVARIQEARESYNRAEGMRRLGGRVSDSSPAQDAADAYDAAVEDALPRAIMATVQALGRKTYRHLLAECPPRVDNESDEQLGFDESKFLDAVLEFYDGETGERTITQPQFDSKNALVAWLNDLSDGVFSELGVAAIRVNQGGSPDPKASLGSQAATMYAATSRSLDSTE